MPTPPVLPNVKVLLATTGERHFSIALLPRCDAGNSEVVVFVDGDVIREDVLPVVAVSVVIVEFSMWRTGIGRTECVRVVTPVLSLTGV